MKNWLARIHMPSASVLIPYLGTVAKVLHDNPHLTDTATQKLGAAGVIVVPVALSVLDSIVKRNSPQD